MLKGDGNENDLISKKKKIASAAHFFFELAKKTNLHESSRVTSPLRPSYILFLWRSCRMCLQKILFPVFMFAFIFSLLLIFTWPLTFLVNYRTAAMKVSFFSSKEIRLPSSFSDVHVSLNIKNNVEKDSTLLRFSSVAFGLPYLLIISNVTNNKIT